jgi:hypothetical protein
MRSNHLLQIRLASESIDANRTSITLALRLSLVIYCRHGSSDGTTEQQPSLFQSNAVASRLPTPSWRQNRPDNHWLQPSYFTL